MLRTLCDKKVNNIKCYILVYLFIIFIEQTKWIPCFNSKIFHLVCQPVVQNHANHSRSDGLCYFNEIWQRCSRKGHFYEFLYWDRSAKWKSRRGPKPNIFLFRHTSRTANPNLMKYGTLFQYMMSWEMSVPYPYTNKHTSTCTGTSALVSTHYVWN